MRDILGRTVAIALIVIGAVNGWRLARRGSGASVQASGFFKGTPSAAFRVAGCAILVGLFGVIPLRWLADYFEVVPLGLVATWLMALTIGVAVGAILHGQ